MSKTTIEEVLKDFDERFPSTPNMKLDLNVWHKNTGEVQTHRQDMHDFLRTTLTTQKEELMGEMWELIKNTDGSRGKFRSVEIIDAFKKYAIENGTPLQD